MLRLDLGLDIALDYIIHMLGPGLAYIDRHRTGIYFHSSSSKWAFHQQYKTVPSIQTF